MSVQIIELDGKPAFAVVPVAQWKALLERLEDLQDAVDARLRQTRRRCLSTSSNGGSLENRRSSYGESIAGSL